MIICIKLIYIKINAHRVKRGIFIFVDYQDQFILSILYYMSYQEKYLKYKLKYLMLKGGVIPNKLPSALVNEISSFIDCKDMIKSLPLDIKDIDWNRKEKPIKNTSLNLTAKNNLSCNKAKDDQKVSCNDYFNKCRLKYLYKKYLESEFPEEFTIDTLNEILLLTIGNNEPIDRTIDRTDLLMFGANLVEIPPNSFYLKRLTDIDIPNTVTTIGSSAFIKNRLTTVNIPNSVTHIGESAFFGNRLTSVTIGNSVTDIGKNAFSSNQLTSVTIPKSVRTVGENAFSSNQLTSVTIPDSVISIGNYAFSSNQLTSVTIPNSVISIGLEALAFNKLTSVIIPDRFKTQINDIFEGNPFIVYTFT